MRGSRFWASSQVNLGKLMPRTGQKQGRVRLLGEVRCSGGGRRKQAGPGGAPLGPLFFRIWHRLT